MSAGQANIGQVAIRSIAGPDEGQIGRAAKMIRVSSVTLYRFGCGRATCAVHWDRIFCASTT